MTPCEDCWAVRNLSLEPRVQGALCGACVEKLRAKVKCLERVANAARELYEPRRWSHCKLGVALNILDAKDGGKGK